MTSRSRPKYLPFEGGQWHMKPGLHPLQIQDWIEIDSQFTEYLTLKAQLLSQQPSQTFGALPGTIDDQQAVLDLLLTHLWHYFPQHYRQQDQQLENLVTGQVWNLLDFKASALDLAGRLVQEDLCLIIPRAEEYVLGAASLCFPFHWQLQDKLGCHLTQIHDPVPGYEEKLKRPVNQYVQRLHCDHPGYRLNWGIVDSPSLNLSHRAATPEFCQPLTSTNVGECLWLRIERQTLRRLQTGGILFTIRTYVHPLSCLASMPQSALSLAQSIEQMPDALLRYKNIQPVQDALITYLLSVGNLT